MRAESLDEVTAVQNALALFALEEVCHDEERREEENAEPLELDLIQLRDQLKQQERQVRSLGVFCVWRLVRH